jgi:ribosome maturation protein SDO1
MTKEYTIARIYRKNENFEILVKPDSALAYKKGNSTTVSNVLVADTIFKDANKGLKASEEILRKTFGTINEREIADLILREGTLQLTANQRKRMIEEKRKQIITFISRQCFNPKSKLPHPPNRIEQAMKQIHYSIDPFKPLEEQANEVIKLLRAILPISMEKLLVEVKIPATYANKVYGTVKNYGAIKKEEWRSNGSLYALMEMSAGIYGILLDKLGSATKGAFEAKVVS